MSDGAVCKSNISPRGRRLRTNVSTVSLVVGAGVFAALAVVHAPWWWRLTVFVPIATGAISGLQVRRNTCVALAMSGHAETPDGLGVVKADEADAAASRRVAAGIRRDGLLIGLAAAALAVLTSFVA